MNYYTTYSWDPIVPIFEYISITVNINFYYYTN